MIHKLQRCHRGSQHPPHCSPKLAAISREETFSLLKEAYNGVTQVEFVYHYLPFNMSDWRCPYGFKFNNFAFKRNMFSSTRSPNIVKVSSQNQINGVYVDACKSTRWMKFDCDCLADSQRLLLHMIKLHLSFYKTKFRL